VTVFVSFVTLVQTANRFLRVRLIRKGFR